MSRRFVTVDPHWIVARYRGACARCGAPILAGQTAFYYPRTRTLLCAADSCGQQAARDLAAADFDETVYQSQYPGR